jgi:hypothetical protein
LAALLSYLLFLNMRETRMNTGDFYDLAYFNFFNSFASITPISGLNRHQRHQGIRALSLFKRAESHDKPALYFTTFGGRLGFGVHYLAAPRTLSRDAK